MDDRDVLLLKFPETIDVDLPGKNPNGWRVHVADNPYLSQQLLQKHPFKVGLAVFEGGADSLADQQNFEIFASQSHMEWIALINNKDELNPELFKRLSGWIYDYHTLPVDFERLLMTMGHAYGIASLAEHGTEKNDDDLNQTMVGNSSVMKNLFKNIRKVAGVDAPVLISGESGTGKELAAKAIHEKSSRVNGPFIVVNCGSLPSTLIQSELFGHEKGSFTGALQRRIGALEAASGGTVFLDEIGDLPFEQQVNLLRFLQESTIQRLGDTRQLKVDVRVIAASHFDLHDAMDAGKFREDLYYRINVLNISIPSLRERKEDIVILAKYFFDKFSPEKQVNLKGFSEHALEVMQQYEWKGNVRELINRIGSAVVMSEQSLITPEELNLERRSKMARHIFTLEEAREEAEHEAILAALGRNNKNVSASSKQLGVSRVTLYRLMEKLGIKHSQ